MTKITGNKPDPDDEDAQAKGKAKTADNKGQGDSAIVDPANMSFIRYILKVLLPLQPRWVQGTVLFVFVFLFVFIVVTTMQASIVLPTTVRVPLTKDQVDRKGHEGIMLEADSYTAPALGYMISHNGFFYALNANGDVRIDLSIPAYSLAVIRRRLPVTVLARDGTTTYFKDIELSDLATGALFFQTSKRYRARAGLWRPSTRLARRWLRHPRREL